MNQENMISKKEINNCVEIIDYYVDKSTPKSERMRLAIEVLKVQEIRNLSIRMDELKGSIDWITDSKEGFKLGG